ncbi:DUF1810 domain-containing protein [Sphingomonas sp. BK580]|uniref:DUF1810 domain-containing protein n=1 Tax=Sphingomonas sp. BK580 TaxID=2586972 RepID=UPI001621D495|nr:DUF1810 domain-containing protein [Sphingomonas sp. BK580]MBB3693951.1 uncharacterized protein (DUF1810 family) [Sphingomonas sp. BK580]
MDRAADTTLDRFVAAQATSYATAPAELRAGAKRSHWMWYIFPQIAGLGHSDMARRYAIRDLAEARAYLAHPLLGARYAESAAALLAHRGRDAAAIMGGIDAIKLRSSLTLFDRAGAPAAVRETLAAFFESPDPATLRLLER